MQKQFDHKKFIIDESALKEVFETYFDEVCTFLNYYTHNKQLIEDIIQDIFIRLWEERETINIFFIKTYLYSSARNRILNHLRNELNRSVLLEEWANREIEKQSTEDCVNMEEFSLIYRQAVNELPEKCREIYTLSREYNKTYKEIAESKNLSIKTIEAQMSIAIKKIKEYMLEHYNRTNILSVIIIALVIRDLLLNS
jgi:RNA polymerase sigma-70 factor (ECF subfamily)